MRRVVAGAFVSLDGVMQAPGGPEEDPTGGFKFGGWVVPYWDDAIDASLGEGFSQPFDLLLGRRTYDIFAAHWPYIETDPTKSTFDAGNAQVAETFNRVTKYVATHSPETLTWKNTQWLGKDVADAVHALKKQEGPVLLVQGSSELLQTLLAHQLVDELRLLIYPVLLGRGKRLFGPGIAPGALKLTRSAVAPTGVVIATYERAGEVKSGSFALDKPTEAELARRKTLTSGG
ncbi:dihydrofolate reductase [Archangium sp. Cb G35]|uniref:dihydrofolate reductase family protein n=1 Tax=Archangium sp. Cb G35 TaxID=1920190 RepID=UPI0009358A2A|nr:dihydrofolate reductase family protein [Archangium sp. Cb G35]OJT19770.1 dihydrofolate reductase [Archangium sp. Cb G35]